MQYTRAFYRVLRIKYRNLIFLMEDEQERLWTYDDCADQLRNIPCGYYYLNAKGQAGFQILKSDMEKNYRLISYGDMLVPIPKTTNRKAKKPVDKKDTPIQILSTPGKSLEKPVALVEKSCYTCFWRKSEDCTQLHNNPCNDYRALPNITREERECYPDKMDASLIREGGKTRNR